MIEFRKTDLFPRLEIGSYTEEQAQDHAELVDRWLGFNTHEVEQRLMHEGCRLRAPHSSGERQQLWIGLAPTRLQTPYVELRLLLDHLAPPPGRTVVDLGCGYGRMGFVLAAHHPGVQFLGFEYVGERVREAQRCYERHGLKNATLRHADLSAPSFALPLADIYFIYDFGSEKAIDKILHDLRRLSRHHRFRVASRGRACARLIHSRHSWLQARHAACGRTLVFEAPAFALDFQAPSPLDPSA